MPTPRKAGRFGGNAGHHKRIMANLATELIRHGRIQTTHAKAKAVQPIADRMVNFAKQGDIASRRQVGKVIEDPDVLHHLFAEVGPANADRPGGYTRVLKLGPRKGDAAPMALIELVEQGDGSSGTAERGEAPRRRWGLRRQGRSAEPSAPAQPARGAREAETGPPAAEPTEAEPSSKPTGEAEATVPDPSADTGDTGALQADPAEVEARLGGDADAEQAPADDTDEADEAEPTGDDRVADEEPEAGEPGAQAGDDRAADGDDDATGRA